MADEKGLSFWKALGMMKRGCVLALSGKASDAIHIIASGITAWRSTGATLYLPLVLIKFGEGPCRTRPIR